jgi:hypothetical protein
VGTKISGIPGPWSKSTTCPALPASLSLISAWIDAARDARWKRPYTDLTYLPQIELLKYLRANGYKTYIVTGGGHALLPPPQSNRIEAAPRLSQKDVP